MMEITKPIIVVVKGLAIWAGAGLVAAADIVVASEGDRLACPSARYGMVAGLWCCGACFISDRRLGKRHRLLLTGTTIDAAEAHRIGLFHELIGEELGLGPGQGIGQGLRGRGARGDAADKAIAQRDVWAKNSRPNSPPGAVMAATARTTKRAG